MANYFELIGKIRLPKKDAVVRQNYDSGWQSTSVNFICDTGDNSVFCRIQGGKWQDDSKNNVMTLTARKKLENGSIEPSKKITIPWKNRFDEKYVSQVAGFKKFTFDKVSDDTRKEIRFAKAAFNRKDISNDSYKKYPMTSVEEFDAAIAATYDEKQSFISEYDFAECISCALEMNVLQNVTYKLKGSYDIQYVPKDARAYATYHVTSIQLASESETPHAKFDKFGLYVTKDFISDDDIAETGKAYINGWTDYYDSSVKEVGYTPIQVSVYGDERKVNYFKKKTTNMQSEIGKIDLVLDIINGTSYREITEDDLTDEEKDDIEFGIMTFEQIKKERGNRIAGDRVSEFRFVSMATGEIKETNLTEEDMHYAVKKSVTADDDLFDDDDDLFGN